MIRLEKYVIGVDLGTSAVKLILVNKQGEVLHSVSKEFTLTQDRTGYSEQNPEDWYRQTVLGLKELVEKYDGSPSKVEGISFSGQMHGLVLLDADYEVLRPAILWNDTRTTKQCEEINERLGRDTLLKITKNPALEGFTLPKILWVKENEPEIFDRVHKFLLPKDYVRYRLTKKINAEYSDAAGTLLLDTKNKEWSKEVLSTFHLSESICPTLISSDEYVGNLTKEIAFETGLTENVKVFAGGADNACGAIGAGILEEGKTLCSIGTSGVILSFESEADKDFKGKVHYFNHAAPEAYYTMGVTLAAGYSLSWFRNTFSPEESYDELLKGIDKIPIGSHGLLFTPYLVGERTPHADSQIRSSFIGIDGNHTKKHFARAVLEGITFSLNESIEIFRENGKVVDSIVAIGGGAKNSDWLQMQADIFNAKVIRLRSEEGPGMGAAMLAAYGCKWFDSLKECADVFLSEDEEYQPIEENVDSYKKLYNLYKEVYYKTFEISAKLAEFK